MAERLESVNILFVGQDGIWGGYKKELLKEELPAQFRRFVTCNKCKGIMREACGVGDPQVFFCETCAQGNEICPLALNRGFINNMAVWCPLKSRGCEWGGHISSSETHLDTCKYLYIECEHLCGAVVERNCMECHLSEECPFRLILCEHCTHSIRQSDLDAHLRECSMFPLHCINGCGDILHRGDMQLHREEICPNSLLECAYRKYGCSKELMRKNLDKHATENRLQHMEILMLSGIKSLREELGRIKEYNILLKRQLALLEDENMSKRSAVYAMSDECATLKLELASSRNNINKRYNDVNTSHDVFVVDCFKPLVDKIENIELVNTHIGTETTGKISPSSLRPLSHKYRDLEHLTLFQEKRTFTLSKVFLRRTKLVSDIWEGIKSDPIRLLKINHEPIYKDEGPVFVRITGVYSISAHCNAAINVCVVLMNYKLDAIERTYFFHVLVKPEITRTASESTIHTFPWKPQGNEAMYVLADIPIEDIQKEGICHMDSINIQICYNRVVVETI